MSKKSIQNVLIAVMLVIALLAPIVIKNTYVIHILIQTLIYCILSIAINVTAGYTGILSLGQAGFYGIGAYIAALMDKNTDVPCMLVMLICAFVTLLLGMLVGLSCAKLTSDYLTLMTIGFGTIVQLVLTNCQSITNGPRGIRGISVPSMFGYKFNSYTSNYYLYLAIFLIILIMVHFFLTSRYGRAFIAIRDDETAAASVGISIPFYKVLSSGIGAMLSGIAGWMLAHFIMYIGPATFSTDESILHMEMAILGGLGTLSGSILGAVILTVVPQVLQGVWEYRMLITGFLMIIMMIWRPQGLIGSQAAGKSLVDNLVGLTDLITGRKKSASHERPQ